MDEEKIREILIRTGLYYLIVIITLVFNITMKDSATATISSYIVLTLSFWLYVVLLLEWKKLYR